MLMTEDEKKRLVVLEWRKRKIIEEEQIKLSDFNADQQRLLIFSHIFKIASKLPRFPKPKRLLKRRNIRLKRRAEFLEQQYQNDTKVKLADDAESAKDKDQKSHTHLTLFHNNQSHYMRKKVPEEILQSYVTHLKKRI